jgi:hypothetical protein
MSATTTVVPPRPPLLRRGPPGHGLLPGTPAPPASPGPGHHRPATGHHRRLLPFRRHRRDDRAPAGVIRATTQDRHGIGDPRPRPDGARRLHRPGCRRRTPRPRPGLPPRPVGLRVSEALNIDIEHLGPERGHRTVTVLGKGSKLAVIPLPRRWAGRSTWPPVNAPAGPCSSECRATG